MATTKTETHWAKLKREQRKRPETQAYEAAAAWAHREIARNHPDEYQDLLSQQRTRVLKKLRAKERADKKAKAS